MKDNLSLSHEYKCKNSTRNISKVNPEMDKMIMHQELAEFITGMIDCLKI